MKNPGNVSREKRWGKRKTLGLIFLWFRKLLVPVSAFSPPLEAANKAKRLIFNRVMKRVKFFKFSFASQSNLHKANQSCQSFAARPEGHIEELQVLGDRRPTITFGNV